uniref:Uncharacterized protein n=1 Tax=Populus trichocarpa TaxID=3694 RepID=A0A2K1X0Z2_POPTR
MIHIKCFRKHKRNQSSNCLQYYFMKWCHKFSHNSSLDSIAHTKACESPSSSKREANGGDDEEVSLDSFFSGTGDEHSASWRLYLGLLPKLLATFHASSPTKNLLSIGCAAKCLKDCSLKTNSAPLTHYFCNPYASCAHLSTTDNPRS